EQVALPVVPSGVRVCDKAPADHGGDDDQSDRHAVDGAVSPGRVEQLGFCVVASTHRDVGDHHTAPGGDRYAEGDEEPLEGNEEVVGDEYHQDRTDQHDDTVDAGGGPTRRRQAEAEQREAGRVDVERRAAD